MGGLWPITSGGRLRSFHILHALSQHNELTVLTTHTATENGLELSEQLPRCTVDSFLLTAPKHNSKRFLSFLAASWLSPLPVDIYKFQCAALRERAESLLATEQFDVCIADFLTAVPNTPVTTTTPVILFSHNVEYMIWQRLFENEKSRARRFLLAIETRKMRSYETFACNTTAATIAVSDKDAQMLQKTSPRARISSVPTGVDIDFFKPDTDIEPLANSLVFSGSMDWQPNEDAMLFFMQSILPIIRADIPTATLSIVGRNPSELLRKVAKQCDVNISGTVPDIRPWLSRASVYIVPLRIGGGTRLKIFEALAMAMPVISTTIGAEGLELSDGIHLQRADSPEEFASQVIALLGDETRRQALGAAGRLLMETHYGWNRVAQHFEDLCREAISPAPSDSMQRLTLNLNR